MFKVKQKTPNEPKTESKTVRVPLELQLKLKKLSEETGVNTSQIIIQMIEYCLNDK